MKSVNQNQQEEQKEEKRRNEENGSFLCLIFIQKQRLLLDMKFTPWQWYDLVKAYLVISFLFSKLSSFLSSCVCWCGRSNSFGRLILDHKAPPHSIKGKWVAKLLWTIMAYKGRELWLFSSGIPWLSAALKCMGGQVKWPIIMADEQVSVVYILHARGRILINWLINIDRLDKIDG